MTDIKRKGILLVVVLRCVTYFNSEWKWNSACILGSWTIVWERPSTVVIVDASLENSLTKHRTLSWAWGLVCQGSGKRCAWVDTQVLLQHPPRLHEFACRKGIRGIFSVRLLISYLGIIIKIDIYYILLKNRYWIGLGSRTQCWHIWAVNWRMFPNL